MFVTDAIKLSVTETIASLVYAVDGCHVTGLGAVPKSKIVTTGGLLISYSSPGLSIIILLIPLLASNIIFLTLAFLPGVLPSPILTTIFSTALYPAPGLSTQISDIPLNGSSIGVPPTNLILSPTA